ncbi:uncharacterized protein LOC131162207 isoform X1 [Malania oleifera]|uniref:uncharacterized protein LOC131162207 isoform X1 n=1 Tax=Malania oleifera TaxID=397392 RepID=UPI0025AEB2F9|nr:uncharacterized protein LOC131162207 isoform X1 [Malania oleifera]
MGGEDNWEELDGDLCLNKRMEEIIWSKKQSLTHHLTQEERPLLSSDIEQVLEGLVKHRPYQSKTLFDEGLLHLATEPILEKVVVGVSSPGAGRGKDEETVDPVGDLNSSEPRKAGVCSRAVDVSRLYLLCSLEEERKVLLHGIVLYLQCYGACGRNVIYVFFQGRRFHIGWCGKNAFYGFFVVCEQWKF